VPADNLLGAKATVLIWVNIASPTAVAPRHAQCCKKPSARSTWRSPMSPSARPSAHCSPTPGRTVHARRLRQRTLYRAADAAAHRLTRRKRPRHPAGESIAKILPCPHGAQGDRHAIQLHGALGFSQDTRSPSGTPGALAAAGRGPRRGAQVEDRQERHQGVPRHGTTASAAGGICCSVHVIPGRASGANPNLELIGTLVKRLRDPDRRAARAVGMTGLAARLSPAPPPASQCRAGKIRRAIGCGRRPDSALLCFA